MGLGGRSLSGEEAFGDPRLGGKGGFHVELVTQKELEGSMLSDHELKARSDKLREERKKAGEEVEEMEEGVTAALDMEDMWKKEASTFTPAPTTTMADSNGDVRSMDRKLDSSLRLLTKLQLGKDLHWDLPWTIREAGETMREAAERGLEERCGVSVRENSMLLGNAPSSFYKYKYPKHWAEKQGAKGAKVFIYKGYIQHQINQDVGVSVKEPLKDYQWATLEEMQQMLDRNTFKAVEQMLMPED